jgi:uncharacterized membrane protein YcaP (DUF421 family)
MNLKKLSITVGIAALVIFVVFAIFVGEIKFNNITNAKIFVYTVFIIDGILVIATIVLSKLASKQDYYSPTVKKK